MKQLCRDATRFLVALALLAPFLSFLQIAAPQRADAATTTSCGTVTSPNNTAQNGIKITPVHGSVFYVDSGQGQTVDASYIGYKVTNSGASTVNDLWIKLDSFNGGMLNLANPSDAVQSVGSLAASGTATVYFLLKAPRSSTLAQSHTVHVYVGRPDSTSSSEKYSCNFTFIKVAETIKASANKVSSIAASTTVLLAGSSLTVTVRGFTGTIGAGSPIDGTMLWFSPASSSSWPTSALRLSNTTVTLYSNKSFKNAVSGGAYTNLLYIKNLTSGTAIASGSKYYYENVYTFDVLGPSASSTKVAPIGQISSGTQIKHTDLSSIPLTTINTNSISSSVTITKTASTTVSFSSGIISINYTITLTNTSTTAVVVDQVLDNASPLLTFKSGSAQTTPQGGSASNYPDAVIDSSGVWVFGQPISIAGAASAGATKTTTLTYTMNSRSQCTGTTSYSYQNSATGKIGNLTLAYSGSVISGITATGSCGSTTTTITNSDIYLTPEVTTQPASALGIGATTTSAIATLNGTVNPHGNSGETTVFELSTSSTLASGVTTLNLVTNGTTGSGTAWYAISYDATGLTQNTTYYFRTKVSGTGTDGKSNTVYGDILSFTTPVLPAPPTVTTNAATNVTTTTADLNGTVNPNAVAGGTTLQFKYAPATLINNACPASLTSPKTVTVVDDTGATLTLTSSSPTDVLASITGLSANTTYCYYIIATYSGGTVNGSLVPFIAAALTAQTITYTQPNSMGLGTTQNTTATASSGLPVTYTSNTPTICTVDSATGVVTSVASGSGGTCSITATQDGNLTYSAATPVTVTFPVVGNVTLSYNLNGGSGTTPASQVVSAGGNTTTASSSGLTLTNFSFDSWNTNSNGSGTKYNASASITVSTDTVLYAQWTATITYNGNGSDGGSPPASQTALAGVIALQGQGTLTNSTYSVFLGWNTGPCSSSISCSGIRYAAGASYNLTGNVTLYAEWRAGTKYRITYYGQNNDGGTVPASQDVNQGSTATLSLSVPTKTGFSFGGWYTNNAYTGGTKYAAGATTSAINADLNLYAMWQGTVAYNANGGTGTTPTTATYTLYGPNFTTAASNTYSKTNYTFNSWNTASDGSGDKFAANTSYPFTGSITLYPIWDPKPITITFDINVNGNNTTDSQPAFYNVPIQLKASTFTNGTAIFNGWATSKTGAVVYADQGTGTFTADTTLYAVWVTSYTVTYNTSTSYSTTTASGSAPTDINSPYSSGATVTVLDNTGPLTLSGYAFVGWCTTNNNANVTACTTGTQYSVGATFTMPSSNVNLYSVWKATYTVTYNAKNSDNTNVSSGSAPTDGSSPYTTGSTVTVLGNLNSLTLTGYTFSGWCTTNNNANVTACTTGTKYSTDGTFTITGNVNLYAVWTTTTYTITTSADSGSTIDANKTVNYNQSSTVNFAGKTGYTITGITVDSVPLSGSTTPTLSSAISSGSYTFSNVLADHSISVTSTAISYSVTVTAGTGGTASGSASTITVTSPVTLTAVVASGYTFASWSCSNATLSSTSTNPATISNPTGNVSCSASFTANTNNSITWNNQGATTSHIGGSSVYTTGLTVSTIPTTAPLKTGYQFDGWFTLSSGGTQVTNGSYTPPSPYGAIILYAQWTGNQYVYYANTGTGSTGPQTYAGSQLTALSNSFTPPVGYEFGGWCTTQPSVGSACSSPATSYAAGANLPTPGSASIPLYAVWSAASNTVSYNNQGATTAQSGGSTSYITGTAIAQIPTTAPLKTGYQFNGWFTLSSGGTQVTNNSYTPGSPYGTIILYAQWSGNQYVYYANTGTGTTGAQTYAGSQLTAKASNTFSAPTGYQFAGWCTTQPAVGSTCGDTTYAAGANLPTPESASIPLYAVWTIKTYQITVTQNSNGTISPDTQTYNHGSNQNYTFTPATGFYVASITVDGTPLSDSDLSTAKSIGYTFTSISAVHSITATYAQIVFTITYSGGTGGTGSAPTNPTTVTYGSTFSTPTNTYSNSGYTFAGWSNGSSVFNANVTYPSSGSVTSNVTLTATWTPITYTVHKLDNYDGNLLTESCATLSYQTGTPVNLGACSPSRDVTYSLVGWGTDANSQSAVPSTYSPAIPASGTDIYLYAIWTNAAVYTVIFNDNYTSPTPATSSQSGYTSTALNSISTIGWSRTGYTFGGWASSSANATAKTVAFANSAAYPFTSGTTLYAIWNAVTYVVTYNSGPNGSGGPATQSFTYPASINLRNSSEANSLITRAGYSVTGWTTGSNSGASQTHSLGASYNSASDLTLYPVWTLKTNTLTYHANDYKSPPSVVPSPVTLATDSTTNVSSIGSLTRANFTFDGWNTIADGNAKNTGVRYAVGDPVTLSSDITLYAQWIQNSFLGVNRSDLKSIGNWTSAANVGLKVAATSITGTTGTSSVTVDVPANTFDPNVDLNYYLVDTNSYANSIIGYNPNYVVNILLTWLKSDDYTVPDAKSSDPIVLTIENSTILANADMYIIIGGVPHKIDSTTLTSIGASVVSVEKGKVVLNVIRDPQLVVQNITYNVTYFDSYADSGSVPTDSTNYLGNGSFTVPDKGSLSKTGYNFSGWCTVSVAPNATCGGTTYSVGSTYNFADQNVNLYSIWNTKTFTITVATVTGGGGTVSASPVNYGGSATLTPTPNPGYTFVSWSCTNSTVSGSTVSNFSNNVVCTPTYSLDTLTITFNDDYNSPANTTSQTFDYGVNKALSSNTFSRSGYNFLGWSLSSGAASATYTDGQSTSFTASKTLYAVWSAFTAWNLTAANANYTIGGSTPTLTATASPSGGLSGSYTCGIYENSDSSHSNALSFSSLTAGTYVIYCTGSASAGYATGTFVPGTLTVSANTYTITVTQGSNGNITPGTTTVNSGNNQSFTITANSGYQISLVTVDNVGAGTVGTYTFSNVTANHTITATFTAVTPPPGGGGGGGAPTPTPQPTNNLILNYRGNGNVGGVEPPTQTISTSSATVNVSKNIGNLEKTGYNLKEWNTKPDGSGTSFKADGSDSIKVEGSSVTLYAVWEPKKLTVTYIINDGTSRKSTDTYIYDGPKVTLPDAQTYGYDFKGWAADPKGNITVGNPGDSLAPTTDIVVYGKWEEKPLRDVVPKSSDPAVIQPPTVNTPGVLPTQPVFSAVQPISIKDPVVSERWIETTVIKPIAVFPNVDKNTGFEITGKGWSIAISSTTQLVQAKAGESNGRVGIEAGNSVTTFGSGFKPNSQVDVYVYSEPTWLGSVITDANGNYKVTLPMPPTLELGDHVFQAKGVTFDDKTRTANVPITLLQASNVAATTQMRKFDIYFTLNSYFLDPQPRAQIRKQLAYIKAHTTKNSKIMVSVIGWVQPTRISPNVMMLSNGRAKAVAAYLKQQGLKATYKITAPGHEKKNVPTSRRASVIITWTNPK